MLKVTLEKELVNTLLPLITKRMTLRTGFEAVSCVVLIMRSQEISTLPKRSFKHICRIPGVVSKQ